MIKKARLARYGRTIVMSCFVVKSSGHLYISIYFRFREGRHFVAEVCRFNKRGYCKRQRNFYGKPLAFWRELLDALKSEVAL